MDKLENLILKQNRTEYNRTKSRQVDQRWPDRRKVYRSLSPYMIIIGLHNTPMPTVVTDRQTDRQTD